MCVSAAVYARMSYFMIMHSRQAVRGRPVTGPTPEVNALQAGNWRRPVAALNPEEKGPRAHVDRSGSM